MMISEMDLGFLSNVFLNKDDDGYYLFAGEQSITINRVGYQICKQIELRKKYKDIIDYLKNEYSEITIEELNRTTENFLVALWKEAIFLTKNSDLLVCKKYLKSGSFIAAPSFAEVPENKILKNTFNSAVLVKSKFDNIDSLKSDLGYKMFNLIKLDGSNGKVIGCGFIEVTRFNESFIVNSLYGNLSIDDFAIHASDIKSCIDKFYGFFTTKKRDLQVAEMLYLTTDNKLFDSNIPMVGNIENMIGLNSLYIYSQKI